MNNLKIGDRVKVISRVKVKKALFKDGGAKIKVGMTGTVKGLMQNNVGIEFNNYVNGHSGSWGGKDGHCWWVEDKCLEKIEETDTKEETKVDTLEQKILTALREEIGVDVGEDFDVYEEAEKVGTYRFGENNFFCKVDDGIYRYGGWEDIVCNFSMYTFKRKAFIPKHGEDYFFLSIGHDKNKNISFNWARSVWSDDNIDYGRLALENVFRSKAEALANKDKLLEKLRKLRKGEV